MSRLLIPLIFTLIFCACGAAPPAIPVAPGPTILPTVTPLPALPTPLPPTAAPTAAPATATAALPTAVPYPRYDLVLTGVTLIDATGAPPLQNAAIAILGDTIAAVGMAESLAFSPDTPVHNLRGATVLPGFINAHVHITGLSDDDLRRWTRAGVTTLRDLSGPLEERVPRRDSFAVRGDPTLPRLLVSGPILTADGGYPLSIGDARLRVAGIGVRGVADARTQANALADAGVDLIKISVSGRTDVSWPELSDAEIAAIAETARARGLPVSAHVDRAGALHRAVLHGISDAAHSPRDRVPDEVFSLMVERGVTMVPTIAVYESLALSRGKAVEWRRLVQPVMYDNLRRFVAAGGIIALGDDFGGVPGMSLGMPMAEIEHWRAAGLTPQQIIEAATRGSAIAAGVEASLGTVEPGKLADLLVVPGDPLTDLHLLASPLLVLRDGQIVGP